MLFDVIKPAIFCLQFFFLASVWLASWTRNGRVQWAWQPC